MSSPSLLRRVTVWAIVALTTALVPLVWLVNERALAAMGVVADGHLAQAAKVLALVLEQDTATLCPADATCPAPIVHQVDRHWTEPDVGFQAYDAQGRLVMASANFNLPRPEDGEEGLRDGTYNGQRWRLYTSRTRTGVLLRIGERYDTRKDVTQQVLFQYGVPVLVLLPLLAGLLGWSIRRGLSPIAALTALLAKRTPGSRTQVRVEGLPVELRPLVETLNHQLERLEDALEREAAFNADVAHELRTPLAATVIHLESAQEQADPVRAAAGLRSAQDSLNRLSRRVEHILALSRLEAGAASHERQNLDLVAIAIGVIEELAPLIEAKDIALSFECDKTSIMLTGHEVAMTSMLRNLIENALRYVKHGGRVDVSLAVKPKEIFIEIADDGPGIPVERRERVFERFRRGGSSEHGYGVGLSIVRRAVQLHDARIELDDSGFGKGLSVFVHIPRPDDEETKKVGKS